MKNVFDFSKELIDEYAKFSTSFAKPSADDIAARLKEEYDSGRYWREPLIQINPNYEKDKTVNELAAAGVLTAECAAIFQLFKQEVKNGVAGFTKQPLRLYKHQRQAISHVQHGESYVVTTGTGSGKSLCFFIPIVNRIIEEKKSDPTPRTRAIIVYPMNALANSQREEMRKFLCDYAEGAEPVSICRYTGQESEEDRKRIRENPPDILLTNYMMLDLILTRHTEDRQVVKNCQGLEFLVLDELHTYRGRQGADVAMLVRRLRAQLNADNLLCVGTSATMAGVGQSADKHKAIAEVASRIFDAPITEHCVVDETLEYVTDKNISNAEMLSNLPARVSASSYDWSDLDAFKEDPFAVWIERTLGIEDKGGHLERATPITSHDAAEKLAEACHIGKEAAREAIVRFLVSMQQKDWGLGDKNKAPFAFKLHQFISGPGQILTTLESPGKRTVELDAQRFAPDAQSQEKRLFPTYFCRFCGEEYIPVWLTSGDSGSPALVKPRELSDNSRENGEDEHSRPGFLCPVESLNADSVFPCDHSATPDEIFGRLPDSWFTLNKKGERVLSDGYKDRAPVPLRLLPNGQTSSTAGTPYWFLPGSHTWYLNCGQTHGDAGRDTNRLVGLSGEGRSSATTVLALSALNLMYANGGENSAKLLGCADAGHVFDAGHRKVAQTFRHRFHSFCRFDILLTAMLRQSFTDFIFVTNTDGSGKAQTNFAHRVRISSSMCENPGLTDHTALLEVGDMSFKSPKKAGLERES